MTITLNIPNKQLFDKIVWLLSRFKNDGLEITTENNYAPSPKKEEENPFADFAGMWEKREISQESIREQAWK